MDFKKKTSTIWLNSILISIIVFVGLGQVVFSGINMIDFPLMIFSLIILIYINIQYVQNNLSYFKSSLLILYILILYFFIRSIFGNFAFIEIYPFIIFLVFISIFLKNPNISIEKTFYISSVIILLLCFVLIFRTNISFIDFLNQEIYLIESKNFIGPFLATCILFYFFKKKKKSYDFILLFMLVLVQIMLLSRTSIVFVLLVVIIFIFLKGTKNLETLSKSILKYCFTVSIILGIIIFLPITIDKFLENENTIDELSSMRWYILKNDFQYFWDNPFFGVGFINLEVHSILIYSLIAGGISFFLLVASYIIVTYRRLILLASDVPKVKSLLLATFLLMFLEVQAPFGPGSSYILLWLLIAKDYTGEK